MNLNNYTGENMEMEILKHNDFSGAVVAYLKGVVNGESSQVFEKRILDLIASGEKLFIFNLAQAEYLTSAAFRSLMVVGKMLKIKRGRLAITNCNDSVKEVFKLMNFDSIFVMFETEEEALKEIGAPSGGKFY
ncbi:MAG TPA: STAS domain-containing protein [Candidatus Wallbacteria bacterium]|nr:MAG: putative anti-sigma factor antagonist BtrV [bacterium ADurb.Bin243]HOD43095.1 STAS domain-containing protein [Candidatus Wallbacteria bacterium]HPG60336.1 STAS domain-containing protein [Candidatus Wallbacteria bacterium]